jgi:aminoglycoside phosphotransferase (APT) family kinase protein
MEYEMIESSELGSAPVLEGYSVEPKFRPAEETVALDWEKLSEYLASKGYALDTTEVPRQFAGGLGNLNYRIQIGDAAYVLRRPPLGPIPPGANDMAREFRVLSRLWKRFPQAPRGLLYCEDPSVLGAHFLIMEYRAGLTIGGEMPVQLDSTRVGSQLATTMVGLLSKLHSIDPAAVGLETLGKPDGFLTRAVDGWEKRARLAIGNQPQPIIDELCAWLRANQVPDGRATLLHCDFKLDNIVLDPRDLRPVAVLDWDMATRGDPLFDLATLLSYWTEASDPPAMHDLAQMPTASPGFPSRREMAAAYAALSGRDLSDFLFYRVLAMFKLGVVFLQLYARYRAGATQNPRFEGFEKLGYGLLEFTHEIAHARAF